MTLTATAEALTGLGDKFGASIVNGNAILDDVNSRDAADPPRHPAAGESGRHLHQGLAGSVGLPQQRGDHARTLNEQQGNLDAALLAAVGFGNTGADVFERGGPYLVRGVADLVPTAQLLDTYSPELFCTIRMYHDLAAKGPSSGAANGYSLRTLMYRSRAGRTRTSIRTTCRGSTPRAARVGRRGAGRRSPAICGRRRIW